MSTLGARPDFSEQSADDLQKSIAETRLRLSRNVDDLSYRLSPAGIGQEVKGTLGGTQQLTFGAIENLSESLLARTEGWGVRSSEFVARYPVSTTLVGFTLAWFMMRSSGRRP